MAAPTGLYRSRIIRVAAILGVLAAVLAPQAHARSVPVVVVPGLELRDLRELEGRAAIGLLVPGAGPETSGRAARAMLERGVVANSLRDPIPSGPPLVAVRESPVLPDEIRSAEVIVVSLPRGGQQPNDRRYPIAVVGDGYRGLLTSDSTRIPGIVSIADVAPTALDRDEALGSKPVSDPLAELRELDQRIDEHNRWRSRTVTWLEVVLVALAAVFAPAALLGYVGLLAANVALGAVHVAPLVALLVLVAGAAAGAVLARVVRSRAALGVALASVLVVYLVSFLVDQRWVALSPLGPTQNARFYGVSNLLETLLLVPALAAAALLARPTAFAAVAALAFVTIAGNRFGADGGGAVVLAVGFAVLGTLLAGGRRRAVVAAGATAVGLVFALLALDAATGASSHVTRALSDGPIGLAEDLADRVTLSWARATASVATALTVALSLLLLGALVARLARLPLPLAARALPFAFAAAIGASMVVNDSPKDVVLAGLVGYVTVEAYALGSESSAGALAARLPLRGRPGAHRAARP